MRWEDWIKGKGARRAEKYEKELSGVVHSSPAVSQEIRLKVAARQSKYARIIAESIIFGGISVLIVYYFELKNESLLLAVLIFGIYLVVSGRISEFKFMDLEVKLKDAESKPLDQLTEAFAVEPQYYSEFQKKGREELEHIILPQLVREARKLKVLKIVRKLTDYYGAEALYNYLKYFSHVVFLDEKGRLSGFANAETLKQQIERELEEALKKREPELEPAELRNIIRGRSSYRIRNIEVPFVNAINEWNLQDPIKKDIYIVKGVSRKQALDKMKELGLDFIPVVYTDGRYEGIIELDTIISQINRELVLRS